MISEFIIIFIINFFSYFLTFYILTLVHELGHALPLLIVTDSDISISLYDKEGKTLEVTDKFILQLGYKNPFFGCVKSNYYGKNSLVNLLISLGGPFISLLCFLILLIIKINYSVPNYFDIALYGSLIQFLITIIPIKYPKYVFGYSGHKSDGLRVLKLLQDYFKKRS